MTEAQRAKVQDQLAEALDLMHESNQIARFYPEGSPDYDSAKARVRRAARLAIDSAEMLYPGPVEDVIYNLIDARAAQRERRLT